MMGPMAQAPLWLALVVGLGFGALLERGGLGSARTIAEQLTGRDFTVFKVMLVAIVTAMLGVFWSARLGWLDLAAVGIPTTDLLPQVVGSVVFGAGFAIASLCPGTACAAGGTGRIDGMAAVAGLFVGTLGIGLVWPKLGIVAEFQPREGALLPQDLGLSTGAVIAALTLLAVGLMPLLARIERGRGAAHPPIRLTPLAGGALALGLLAVPAAGSPRGLQSANLEAIAREITSEADHVEALELAEWIHSRRPGLRIIDVRDDLAPDDYSIPGAERVPLAMIPRLEIAPGTELVLYSEGGAHAAQAWVLLRAQGITHVRVLLDGMAAWEDEVMSPAPPRPGDPVDAARHARTRVLMEWFGGSPRDPTSASGAPTPVAPRRRKTC